MKFFIKKLILLTSYGLFVSCQPESQLTIYNDNEDTSLQTIASESDSNNTNKIFQNVELDNLKTLFNFKALGSLKDESVDTRNEEQTEGLIQPLYHWNNLVHLGPVKNLRNYLELLSEFQLKINGEISKIQDFNPKNYSLIMDDQELFGRHSNWLIDFTSDENNPEVIKQIIRDKTTDAIFAVFYLKDFKENVAQKIRLGFINEDNFSDDANGLRMLLLSYDTTNKDLPVIAARVEEFDFELEKFVTYHLHMECHLTELKYCTLEFIEKNQKPSNIAFSNRSFRMSWNNINYEIKAASTNYDGDQTLLGPCQSFIGPHLPTHEMILNNCYIEPPFYWGEKKYPLSLITQPFNNENISSLSAKLSENEIKVWDEIINFETGDNWISAEFFN